MKRKQRNKIKRHIRKLKGYIKDYTRTRNAFRITEKRMERDLPVIKKNIAVFNTLIHDYTARMREFEQELIKTKRW